MEFKSNATQFIAVTQYAERPLIPHVESSRYLSPFGIKLLHTVAFLVVSAAILYILYCGLLNLGGTGLVIAVMIVVLEIAVFAANGMHCPLTKIAQRLGDEAGNDFIADIFCRSD